MSACQLAFDGDNDGFACSITMGISNLSLSLSHEYHHLDSLQLNKWESGRQTTLLRGHRGSLLPCGSNPVCVCLSSWFWCFGVLAQMMTSSGEVTERSLVAFLKCFLAGHVMITYEEPKKYLMI
jgi:hypothetical protein